MSRWTQFERSGIALYLFSPSGPHEIELYPGDTVKVLEECGEWLRGAVAEDGRTGLFPRAFVHLKAPARRSAPSASTPRKPLPTPPSVGGKNTRPERAPSSPSARPPRDACSSSDADAASGNIINASNSNASNNVSNNSASNNASNNNNASNTSAAPPLRKGATLVLGGGRRPSTVSPPASPRKDAPPRSPAPSALQRSGSISTVVSAPPQHPQQTDPIILELVSVLHEWSGLMWASYAEHNTARYIELKDRLYTLRSWYTRILNPSLPVQVRDAIKGQVVDKIEKGKRAMKLDLVIKNKSGQVMTDANTPVGLLLRGFLELKQQKKKRDPHENSLMTNTIRRLKSRGNGEDQSAGAASSSAAAPLSSSLSSSASSASSSAASCGLLLKLGTCVLGLGQPVVLAFQLWKKNEFISDTFWVHLDAKSMPEQPKVIGEMGNIRTLFRDLSLADLLSGDVWLVCRITRFGPMSLEKKSKSECRRPVGMAVLQLGKQLFKQVACPADSTMEIYSCPLEQQFATMHELLITSIDRSGLVVVPKTHPLKVSLQILLTTLDVDLLEAHKFLVGERVFLTERAVASRSERHTNRLLLTLVGMEGIGTDKNIEVVVEALDGGGKEIEKAFRVGVPRGEFRTWVMKRAANPVWRETIVVDLDAVAPATTTLLFSVNHVTKLKSSPLGCVVLNVTTADGTVIGNTTHVCPLLRSVKKKSDAKSLAQKDGSSSAAAAAPGQMSLSIATRLDSTELSQNASMYALLQWQKEAGVLRDTLSRFMYVEQAEIMRFLPDAMNALFDIMAARSELCEAAFYCLVHVLSTLLDERSTSLSAGDGQENLRRLLDRYVSQQYSAKEGDKHICEALLKAFENPAANKKRLVGLLKSMGYLLVFMHRSVELRLARKPDLVELQSARGQLVKLFASVCKMTTIQDLQLLSVQATAVRSVVSWIPHLKPFFPAHELAKVVADLVAAVPIASGEKAQNLTAEKLSLVYQLAVSPDPLFLEPASREVYFRMMLEQIEQCERSATLKYFVRLLLSGLMEPLQSLQFADGLPDEAVTLFSHALQLFEGSSHDEEAFMEAATVFMFFLYRMQPHQFVGLFRDNLELYGQCVRIVDRLAVKPVYDLTWFALIMFQFSSVLRFFELSQGLFSVLSSKLLTQLINLCMLVVASPHLDMSSFSQTKQQLVDETYGDIRLRGLAFLRASFDAVEAFVPGSIAKKLVPVYLQMLLVDQADVIMVGGNFYWNAVKFELNETTAFLDVLTVTIDAMGHPRAVAKNLGSRLVRLLEKRFQKYEDLKETGQDLMLCISEFEELLKSIYLLPPTPDYDVERTMATLSLLSYLVHAQSTSYNSYALQLLLQNLKSNQLAEAAFVLLRMAENLEDSDVMLEAMEVSYGSHVAPFGEEASRVRRERMLLDAASLLEKDSQYETALSVLEQHAAAGHETAALRERVAVLERKIATEERLVSEYFRVGFYGLGFGNLNGTALVFRGALLERLDEFNARMQQQFPAADLLSFTSDVPLEIAQSTGQHLQIFRVFPSSRADMEGEERPPPDRTLSQSTRRFRRYNNVNVFMYEKPVKKGKSGNEVADLWVEQTFFVTTDSLPTIARFASVESVHVRELSPLQLAVNTMAQKNADLEDAIATYSSSKPPSDAQPFISLVQGVVDAAVGGGFRVYQDVFFNPKYGFDQEEAAVINLLVHDQIAWMGEALQLWPKVCPASFQPLFEHLEKQFQSLAKK